MQQSRDLSRQRAAGEALAEAGALVLGVLPGVSDEGLLLVVADVGHLVDRDSLQRVGRWWGQDFSTWSWRGTVTLAALLLSRLLVPLDFRWYGSRNHWGQNWVIGGY